MAFKPSKSELTLRGALRQTFIHFLDEMNRNYSWNKKCLVQGTPPYEREIKHQLYYSVCDYLEPIEYNNPRQVSNDGESTIQLIRKSR